jgi:hypothetical protein
MSDVPKPKRGRKSKMRHEEKVFWGHDGTYIDVEATQEIRQALGEVPTQYQAPGEDQKWRARNVISFHWRHLDIKVPPGYRDVMLCAIDHANPGNGRCDAGQRRMGGECKLGRQYVNKAMQWWTNFTDFIRIENRQGKTNAYHVHWDALEEAWHAIQYAIGRNVTEWGVAIDTTPGVATDTTGGVATDTTLNIKITVKRNLILKG